jgi:hypothetical protein
VRECVERLRTVNRDAEYELPIGNLAILHLPHIAAAPVISRYVGVAGLDEGKLHWKNSISSIMAGSRASSDAVQKKYCIPAASHAAFQNTSA